MQNRNIPNEKPSALIISAGNSSRMGIPKFMLRFDANFTFLEKIVDEYLNYGCRQIVVVLNPDGEKTIKNTRSKISGSVIFAINPNPLKERLLSVQIGLQHLQMPQKVFIHPVDNPFVIHSVLDNLLCNSINTDYLIPSYLDKGGHPILISDTIMNAILEESNPEKNLNTYLKRFNFLYVPVFCKQILTNINTKADFESFQKDQSLIN